MSAYRFRCSDESGDVVGLHFVPFDRNADAQRYADDLRASGKFTTVEFAEAGERDGEPVRAQFD